MTARKHRPRFARRADADAFAVQNRKLVFSQAQHFVGLGVLTRDELISEGDLALLRAARKWPGLGVFSTYAVTSIKRAMVKAIRRRQGKHFIGQEPPDDEHGAWLDTLPDSERETRTQQLDLTELTPLEQRVLTSLYATSGRALTVVQVGRELGLDTGQVEQIRDTALAALREIAGYE